MSRTDEPLSDEPVRSAGSNGAARSSRVAVVIVSVVVAFLFITSLLDTGLLSAGMMAPPFTLERATPPFNAVSLSDYVGNVVVLDFWSTTCPPCLREIEILKRLYAQYAQLGVVVIGISVGGESPAEINAFSKERGVDFPMLVDSRGLASQAYRVSALPAIYIIDAEGRIVAAHSGFQPASQLEAQIRKALSSR